MPITSRPVSPATLRPTSVTLAGLGALVAGFASVWPGLARLQDGLDDLAGWTGVVLGVVILFLAYGVLAGRRGARLLVSLAEVLQIAAVVLLGTQGRLSFWGLVQVALAVALLVLLWNRSANAFFRLQGSDPEPGQSSGSIRPRSGTASEV